MLYTIHVFRWSFGRAVFDCLGSKIDKFLAFNEEGSKFFYGYAVDQKPFVLDALENGTAAYDVAKAINDAKAFSPIIAFKILPVFYFFSMVVAVLFHFGAIQVSVHYLIVNLFSRSINLLNLQWLTEKIGRILQKVMGTTAAESFNAAGNIYLGQAIMLMSIKPYLSKLTKSEAHAVIVGGMATMGAGFIAIFVNLGVPAAHLLAASFMSAPAALAFAKLMYPETETSKTTYEQVKVRNYTDYMHIIFFALLH